jgi:pimeloyl-ACP methyl ester carboxylesterase
MVLFWTLPRFVPEFLTAELQQLAASPPPSMRESARKTRSARSRSVDAARPPPPMRSMTRGTAEYAERSHARGYCSEGILRQMWVVGGWGEHHDKLATLATPAAIIHGRADRLLKVEASFELGQLIPDSELHIYPGLGQ